MPKPGFLTPSSFDKLMSGFNREKPNVFNDTSLSVVNRLASDILGYQEDGDESNNAACNWGIENEYSAIDKYKSRYLVDVRPDIFTVSDDCSYVGGTMDGLIGLDRGLEVKNPYQTANHINRNNQYLKYKWQITGYFWIKKLKWIDFLSHDPRLPEPYDLILETFERNNSDIEMLRDRCIAAYKKATEIADIIRQKCKN